MIFLNSASSAAALVFYLPALCTQTDTEGKQSSEYFEKFGKKHNIYRTPCICLVKFGMLCGFFCKLNKMVCNAIVPKYDTKNPYPAFRNWKKNWSKIYENKLTVNFLKCLVWPEGGNLKGQFLSCYEGFWVCQVCFKYISYTLWKV